MQETPGSVPGLGRSAGEGIGYPHQYSWASLVAQLVKNPPAMRETWVRSLGWEDPLLLNHFSRVQLCATPWIVHGILQARNTGVGSCSLLPEIFPTLGSNLGLPHCRQILSQLNHQGSPRILVWVAYPFSRGSSRPRN